METANPVAVVTGSSSGIGKAIATRLLRSGYQVVLNYANNDTRAAQTLAICRLIDPNAVMVKADVSDAASAADLIQHATDAFGRIDVLVNNAASIIDRPFLDMTEHEWDRVIDVNLKGAFLCSQHAARQMLRQEQGGVILNIGASTGIRGRRNGANTCASKAGLMILTQCLALELGPKVRVNTIIPGLTLTDETRHRFRLDDPDTHQAKASTVPLQRLGLPEDVANAVMLALSSDAGFITGQKIVVDGGQYPW